MSTQQLDAVDWAVWSTTARVVVTDPELLDAARDLVVEDLDAVDRAASRFRPDSELARLAETPGVPQRVSPVLAQLVRAALVAAEQTGGDVDPTLGARLQAIGYDRDIEALRADPATAPRITTSDAAVTLTFGAGGVPRPGPRPPLRRATWRDVVLVGSTLTVPPGVSLDLGATAKAWTADRAAQRVHERLGTGVLVSLGGDLATAGPAPHGGWQVLVADGDGEPSSSVALPGGAAIATSSTIRRTWTHDGREVHHILDPRTGLPARPVWRTVSVAAPTCVLANTLSTAAIVRGRDALTWFAGDGVTARFVAADGTVATTGSWPR